MRLIAIAHISNGKDTLGLRLLDIDAGNTKDVPLSNIKDILKSGNIQIENLTIQNEEVTGYNGSIERLPKLVNNQLVGKSPLIIINQLGEVGYEVCDFKGAISKVKTAAVMAYAKANGIANGKIVNKEEKEFISAIEGTYKTKTIEKPKKVELYTGELVYGGKTLLPILITYPTDRVDLGDRKTVINCYNGQPIISSIWKKSKINTEIDINNIKKELMYECNGFTLLLCAQKNFKVTSRNQEEIIKLLKDKGTRDSVDASITGLNNRYAGYNKSRDAETGLLIPKSDMVYESVIVDKNIDGILNSNDAISAEEIEKYIKKLKVMGVRIFIRYNIQSKTIALVRECSTNGISYKTYKVSAYGSTLIGSTNLEDIHQYNKEYDNVTINGNQMQITGFDGVYNYDMEKIQQEYHRTIMQSNRNIKAALLKSSYHEGINEIGELKRFRSDSPRLIIPSSVKIIKPKSIIISTENKELIFGSNIEECDENCFDINRTSGVVYKGLEYIEINCNEAATKGILKTLNMHRESISKDNLKIRFNRAVTSIEYAEILNVTSVKVIEIKNNIDDDFIMQVLKRLVEDRLNNLLVLKKKIPIKNTQSGGNAAYYRTSNNDFETFTSRFEKLISDWAGILEQAASNELQEKINKFISDTQEQIKFREKELKSNIEQKYELIKSEVKR